MQDFYEKRLLQAQKQFGAARFDIGRMLFHIKERGFWRGKARSFAEFLEAHRINQSAARQYMRVAKAFIIDLNLPEAMLEQLYGINMSTLEQAAKVITPENADEVLAKITTLSERDAKYELSQLDEVDAPCMFDADRASPEVARLLSIYKSLPDELQMEARDRMGPRAPAAASGAAS